MDKGEELIYKIAFSSYKNINVGTAERFAGLGITPEDFFNKSASVLASLTGIKASFFDDSRRVEALEQARRELDFISSGKVKAIYYTSADYPSRLAECPDAPAMLYFTGTVQAASAPHSVAIVGTRHYTAYGADFTRRLVADLSERLDDVLVVSGLAYGVDICSHRAAIDCGVPTAAVLAHGLNTIYPSEHRNDARKIITEGGFLMTEYRTNSHIHKGSFLARNRLIAALADVTVVVESDLRGGAMATARLASEYNREVMALPGRVNDTYSRGCNELIATNRASVIRDASDLIGAMGWRSKSEAGEQYMLPLDVPQEYSVVIDALRAHPDATVNDICVILGIPFAQLSALLFRMEMDDYVISRPGGRYALTTTTI